MRKRKKGNSNKEGRVFRLSLDVTMAVCCVCSKVIGNRATVLHTHPITYSFIFCFLFQIEIRIKTNAYIRDEVRTNSIRLLYAIYKLHLFSSVLIPFVLFNDV